MPEPNPTPSQNVTVPSRVLTELLPLLPKSRITMVMQAIQSAYQSGYDEGRKAQK